MVEVELTEPLTGTAIREYLMEVGEGHPNGFYTAFKAVKPSTSYQSVRRYFWICKKLGLIEPTRREFGRGYIPKQLYRIVPGAEGDPRWSAPQASLYPETRLGARRYKKRR